MNQSYKSKTNYAIIIVIVILIFFFFKSNIKNIELGKPISYLSYEDLIKISHPGKISKELELKLNKQLTTPYIANNKNVFFNNSFGGKKSLKIGHWNIERGYKVNDIKNIFSDLNINSEAKEFSMCEIILLNEVDIGMPRTKYKNIAEEIASAGKYNYAFATEFIELAPIVFMGKHERSKYKGLHGNVVLSKYPIKSAYIIRLPNCYDWYNTELQRKSPLESMRKYSARTVFKEEITTSEVRKGSRNALVVTIELPNKEIITVVSTHLEDRAFPQCRLSQIHTVLSGIRGKTTPVILAGDFNTTTTDSIPTSFKKEFLKRVKDPEYLARTAAFALIPGVPYFAGLAATGISKLIQFNDPTATSIPILFPNKEKALFNDIQDFRFNDGGSFDFRGNPGGSSNGRGGLLANSNERSKKGFEYTFKFEEPRLIAYFKLDWFFIKGKKGKYTPFNGKTLKNLNESIPGKISDHNPITVDLRL